MTFNNLLLKLLALFTLFTAALSGQVAIHNRCPYPVYLQYSSSNSSAHPVPGAKLKVGGFHVEQYNGRRTRVIHMARNARLSTPMDFEYTAEVGQHKVFWSLSINGRSNTPGPFSNRYFSAVPAVHNINCQSVRCRAYKSNSCANLYNGHGYGMTMGCPLSTNVRVTLCGWK